MTYLSPEVGYRFLLIFGVVMVAVTYLFARWKQWHSNEGFLVAGRNVGWFLGGTSIAASWIWAPALFISVQIAYQKGLPGIFWFTFPNIIALALFALFAPKIREKLPEGYTLPQYVGSRLNSERVHKLYLFPYFFYQLMAVTVQLVAGGGFVSLLTGIPITHVMPILALIAISYTLISGLEASIVTDFVQMLMIVVIGALIIPMVWKAGGGFAAINPGLGGLAGTRNMFDPGVAFSFGIVTSIGLLAGALSDQQYWQRSFAIKKNELKKAFIFGALLFGIVPIALSILGFLAANPALSISLPEGVDVSMIGVQTVTQLLPSWAVFLFVVMLLSGLSSTLDSGLSATSSLWVTDVVKSENDNAAVAAARKAIVGMGVVGLLVALGVLYVPGLGLQQLWWIFNTIAASVAVPTILSLYWDRLDERGVFWGVLSSFVIGVPFFVYTNVLGDPFWIVAASLGVVLLSTVFCLVMPKKA